MHVTTTSSQRPSLEEWLASHPPIMGADDTGDPSSELTDALAAIASPAEPGEAETGDPTGEPADPAENIGAGFRLEDVPEENGVREHVKRYVDQVHGAFTKKTQGLAEQRREVESLQDLNTRLGSDDPAVRNEALQEFLAKHDLEFEPASDEEAAQAAAAAASAGEGELEQRLGAVESRLSAEDAQKRADEQQAYISDVRSVLDDGLGKFAKTRNFEGGQVPPEIRDFVIAKVAQLPPVDGLWPDVDKAVEAYEAWEAKVGQVYVSSKRGVVPDASGSSGVPTFDATKESERIAAAAAVAGRHLG